MQKPWLASYPPGVPAEIDSGRYASLAELFERNFVRFRDKRAFSNMGVAITYGELERLSRDIAAYFTGELGLAKGERVAIMLPIRHAGIHRQARVAAAVHGGGDSR